MVMPPRRPGGGSLSSRGKLLEEAVELLASTAGDGIVRVLGESMRPTILPGRRLRVELAPPKIRLGDVILFRQADYLAVHRFLGRVRLQDGRRCLRTRGDGVLALDPAVDPSRVVGTIVSIERVSGWRSLRGVRARAYAVLLAAHDLFWAGVGAIAGRCDGWLKRPGQPAALRARVARVDRWLLEHMDVLLFDRVHARTAEPVGTLPGRGDGEPGP